MAETVLIEVCVDSAASAVAAERGGAARVELCSSRIEGGNTPSAGMIESVRDKISIGLQVIIRPRGGDFCYEDEEIEVMAKDIVLAKRLGADGVVFGILDIQGNVDVRRTSQLLALARPMNVTFHRAFDMARDLPRALEVICSTGADRVLTSGGEQQCVHGAGMIARLVKAAQNRTTIMAGGGIRQENVATIIERTGVREIHVGLSSPFASPMLYRNPRIKMGKAQDREYQREQVRADSIRDLQRTITLAKT